MCIYVCVHGYLCTRMGLCMYVYVHVCITWMYVYVCACVYISMCACLCAILCIYLCVCVGKCVFVCSVCVHICLWDVGSLPVLPLLVGWAFSGSPLSVLSPLIPQLQLWTLPGVKDYLSTLKKPCWVGVLGGPPTRHSSRGKTNPLWCFLFLIFRVLPFHQIQNPILL